MVTLPSTRIISDMVVVPDFEFGAMENWGLITYRDVNLLYDSQKSASASRERVTQVVTHELSHQVNVKCRA